MHPYGTVQYSLSKKKRWEEIEQLKKTVGVTVCEERRRLPRRAAPFRKLRPKVLNDLSKSLPSLIFANSSVERKDEWVKARRVEHVTKGRAGRVWKKKRQPGKKVSSRRDYFPVFPFAYLWGVTTIYVVLKPKDQDQYNFLAALKSGAESKFERSKRRASKKSEKHELMQAITSVRLL
jgi:hypothetical protein